ncbi:PREDICTED: interactor of constitutive active ROPs 2, chloroplastic-like [Ipomoea nil]|uniref:interactor of constitutive active ROPs 2, chloroplastic-like n=1 Tax=Ipomoea nil TaxID=35883 RepID=UPI00090187A9|nr:PREDICTED: interactor of constitutive active ROPs 2, chloroplastic-like [Ipomoea nil]XP_019191446.1 PREDICTED: interactor of constitutive active ROPs 2, chloroplastic-like [Ipomoea nil]XP_019191447.1 PREDICTED: interactor of constitutive active ROPs 2, chloroplastic-like [Ipomoea nil]XP_019191448.1 PREDICTED: interactor of constitutive active ROPs 2, chloroplastic-like [Ipomoea nil]XP_019191449.1 PREDICTED: interactor of constitutive active ROPs 2, chloroplastic-like [Ipomoea nil]XP_0191914
MQTPKARTTTSVEVPQRTSPATPRTARKLRTGTDSDSVSSPNPASRTPKDRSPKVVDRRSPRSPATEKKRPAKVSELEARVAQLVEELKTAKDQLTSSEALKKKANLEMEETKKQLAAMSEKVEESQKQLLELSDSEDARVQELRKISQDRDRAWQSELEAVQKQHELDTTAMASAQSEIQKLKIQLERVAESEAAQARRAESAHNEIQGLRIELAETLSLIEKLKSQLNDCKVSEAQALEEFSKAQMQLEVARMTEETLRLDCLKVTGACQSMAMELEQSKNRVSSLEELVGKLQSDLGKTRISQVDSLEVNEEEASGLKTELNTLEAEANQLRAALEEAERRNQEEYIQSTLQIRSAYELMERTKSESFQKETELEAKLKMARADVEALQEKLMEKEAKLQSISNENERMGVSNLNLQIDSQLANGRESELEAELKKSGSLLADLEANLSAKETELQTITQENETLKSEIKKRDEEGSKVNEESAALLETAKAAEREALMKLGYLTEEADKSSRKAARVTEQLDAAQAANSELETELRKLKVQSDQWRKAAEAAAAMLTTGNNGKFVGRTGSMDYHTIGGKLGSPFSEDMEDDSPKKKNNGSVLKKIGVLLKKGQK